jgi:ABC-type lipoprotein export system ATPase subunit
VPRFVDISLGRALADRPQQASVYFQHSLASLQRLINEVRPLSTFIEQANGVLRGCTFRIAGPADLKAHKLSAPPDQQQLLVVKFGTDEAIHRPTELSSGQQHMLVLLGRIWLGDLTQRPEARTGSRLLLIDEPEISLHLAWHSEIAKQLRRFADETKSQVIVATHSNFISGSLPPSIIFEM